MSPPRLPVRRGDLITASDNDGDLIYVLICGPGPEPGTAVGFHGDLPCSITGIDYQEE